MTTNMTSQKDFILHNIFNNSQPSKNWRLELCNYGLHLVIYIVEHWLIYFVVTTIEGACPEGFFPHGDSCYFFSSNLEADWIEAGVSLGFISAS